MNAELPVKCLSIRQPWAWLIANGHKNFENRLWSTSYRGPCCIHAAKSMTRKEWEVAEAFAQRILGASFILPDPENLQYGGIIAVANITEMVPAEHLQEPQGWLTGPWGWRLENVKEVEFVPLRGALGCSTDAPPKPGWSGPKNTTSPTKAVHPPG